MTGVVVEELDLGAGLGADLLLGLTCDLGQPHLVLRAVVALDRAGVIKIDN